MRKEYYTHKEICEMLNIHRNTLDQWRAKGKINGIKIQRSLRFDATDVERLIEESREQPLHHNRGRKMKPKS